MTLFVYIRNPRSATNIIFSLLGFTISIWLIIFYLSLQSWSIGMNLLLIRFSIFFATLMSALFFLLAHTLPSNKILLKSGHFLTLTIITCFVMIITISPYAFTDVKIIDNLPSPTPGPGLAIFAIFAILSSFLSIYLLFRRLQHAKGLERQQLLFITLGILLMYGLMILTVLLPVALFKINTFVTLTPLYTFLFLGTAAYTIIKHRFLDIRFIVARTVAFVLLLVVFGGLYSLVFFFLGSTFLNIQFSVDQLLFYGITILAVAFSFQPLRRVLEKLTDNIFYRDRYETSKLLYDLALIMAATLLLEDLAHRLLKTLLMEMKIARGAFILTTDQDRIYRVAHEGYQTPPEFDEEKIKMLLSQHQMLVFEELPEGDIKSIMRDLNITIVCYLRVKSGHIGILALGEKQSGDIYTSKDIDLLEIFTPEAAVAIQNAQSYEEIRRFSVTLQQEVDRATKDLQVANEKLKALDKLKDEFLSLASHELRTPMGAVKSYLWMVINKPETLDSNKRKLYLDRALNATVRLIALVNDMLNVSRIESGRIKLTPKQFSIVDLAKEIVEELTVKAREKNISLTVTDASVPAVFADSDKMREVIINLIGNALKFTDNNGKVAVSFSKVGEIVTTHVNDTGRGISKEDISKLFTKFGRLENSLSSVAEVEGTGLGLYICKQYVELSQGKVTVTSELGKGSTFSFFLPTKPTSSPAPLPN